MVSPYGNLFLLAPWGCGFGFVQKPSSIEGVLNYNFNPLKTINRLRNQRWRSFPTDKVSFAGNQGELFREFR